MDESPPKESKVQAVAACTEQIGAELAGVITKAVMQASSTPVVARIHDEGSEKIHAMKGTANNIKKKLAESKAEKEEMKRLSGCPIADWGVMNKKMKGLTEWMPGCRLGCHE
jgi:hypothetical protein